MHRSASRLTRVLACAAVPVILTVAGCSSDSGKKSGTDSGKKSESSSSSQASSEPSKEALEKAAYATLPDPCKAVSAKTIGAIVPKAKDANGTAGKSNDLTSSATCTWNGLDEAGLKGSQYRWLSVSMVRYDPLASVGTGNKRAEDEYAKQVEKAKAVEGAENVKPEAAGGIGDQATSVTFTTKKDGDFFNTSVIARTQNVVVTLDYNGTAYEGATAPDQAKLLQDAIAAAKETVASVQAANGAQQSAQPEQSAQPSQSPSPSNS
ncbi:DUF3558 family protein [Streptomyces sp. NBC_01264]|uniref:DUF3558 family protein n=1 Tax=Streptomyces sp. NBC_01264 TaxID=2903804 RepID=UPI002255D0D2|nr:DUF3558 family protein [Streptomyces sp. NBC_01264]MCX4780263.1 DUF3558 family protein [Streptomyces sp. NBC_01264]